MLLAVHQMTDLIDSLLEFSRTRDLYVQLMAIWKRLSGDRSKVCRRIRNTTPCACSVNKDGATDGWFDSRKLERVFQNLLLNACEAVSPDRGHIIGSTFMRTKAPSRCGSQITDTEFQN